MINKQSVTTILSEIFPYEMVTINWVMWDPLEYALSTEAMSAKRLKWDILEDTIAHKCYSLKKDNVMKMLNIHWTIIHSCAFDLWTMWFCHSYEWTHLENHVNSLVQFFEDYKVKTICWEKYIENEWYFGISDWIIEVTNPDTGLRENWLIDWKTWSYYKYIYGIKNSILKKNWEPYSKANDIKKTSVQLSMYEYSLMDNYKIDDKKIIWITEQGYFVFQAESLIDIFWEWLNMASTKLKITT